MNASHEHSQHSFRYLVITSVGSKQDLERQFFKESAMYVDVCYCALVVEREYSS